MSNYELTYILRPLEEANLTATNERITSIVQNAGGDIVARNDWGRRRLAYPIRKINDGYYTTLYVKLPGTAVRGLERSLQLIDDVQRYLVVRVDEFKLPTAPEASPVVASAPIAGTIPPSSAAGASAAGASAVGASLAGATPAEASLAAVIPTEPSPAEAATGTTAATETTAAPDTTPATTAQGG